MTTRDSCVRSPAVGGHLQLRYILTLKILENPKWGLWQIVKTQMKCSIMLHFIRVCTDFLDFLFDMILYAPINNFSVMLPWDFLG